METEERKVQGYLGSVSIPIYFDLTGYKAEELEKIRGARKAMKGYPG